MRCRLAVLNTSPNSCPGPLTPHARKAGPPAHAWVRPKARISRPLLHGSQVKAGPLFSAAHVEAAITKRRRTPALASKRLEPGDFLIGLRDGLDDYQLAVIGEGQKMLSRQDDLACPEPRLLPSHRAGLQVHALQLAGAKSFEADHAVEKAVPLHRRAPQVGHVFVAGDPPQP